MTKDKPIWEYPPNMWRMPDKDTPGAREFVENYVRNNPWTILTLADVDKFFKEENDDDANNG